jgi:hypothetical protein
LTRGSTAKWLAWASERSSPAIRWRNEAPAAVFTATLASRICLFAAT